MGARLLYRDSQGRDGHVDLNPSVPVHVGRGLDCAIRTDDAMVSRKHSAVTFSAGRYWVEDMGSSNGTHVNDVRVQKQALNHNDVVRCGSIWLRYIEDGPLVAAQPQAAAQAARPAQQPGGYDATMAVGQPGAAAPLGLQHAATAAAPGLGVAGPAVVIDMQPPTSEEALKLRKDMDSTRTELDKVQGNYDREVADGKRLRAEVATLKDRVEELRRTIGEREEMAQADSRVTDELREELQQTSNDLATVRVQLTEALENLKARDRQMAQARDEVGRLKADIDDNNRQLAEVSRTKDEGWRKLNEQLSEIEHLREVINQQERILEERRVGLISLEEALKELRADKETRIKEMAQLRAERDNLRSEEGRRAAQIAAVDEENKRLARILAELQTKGGGSGQETLRLANDAKDLRVELRKAESDRDRLQEMYDRSEQQRDKSEGTVASLQEELRDATEKVASAERVRSMAEDSMAKAEVARQKLAEESVGGVKERDDMLKQVDEARREANKLKRRVTELESAASAAPSGPSSDEVEEIKGKLRDAEARAADAERGAKRMQAELDAALQKAKSAPAAAPAAEAGGGGGGADGGGEALTELRQKASEVYDGLNGVLRSFKNDLGTIQSEMENVTKEYSGDSARTIADTIEILVGNAEEASGLLRGLRDLAEPA